MLSSVKLILEIQINSVTNITVGARRNHDSKYWQILHSQANLGSVNMPVIEILNPQDPIPGVDSKYTVLKGMEVDFDLNEDSWATDYFIIFFHTGPNDPVSTSILRYCSCWLEC